MSNNVYISNNYLLIYETNILAGQAEGLQMRGRGFGFGIYSAASSSTINRALEARNFWTKKLGYSVVFSSPKEPIFRIKRDAAYWHVIIGEKVGWIIVKDGIDVRELKHE